MTHRRHIAPRATLPRAAGVSTSPFNPDATQKEINTAAGLTSNSSPTLAVSGADALAGIPTTLRDELLARFNDVLNNYRQGHWEAATLNGGKFCEVVYTILKGRADGNYPGRAKKPIDMVQACRALENADEARMGRALRIQIPRAIPAVYEIRNNRGTGHAGAEVDPNHMDAEYVLHACQWMLADLVRAYHQLDTAIARQVVEALVERVVPLIWDVDGVKRVLDPEMKVGSRVLVLLYATAGSVADDILRVWSQYKNPSRFRDQVLAELHIKALIHHDTSTGAVTISPLGRRVVENDLLRDRVLL